MTAADVYRALWRHKTLIVFLTAVFVGATWYFTSRETKTYEASALIRIQPARPGSDVLNGLEASQRLAQTYKTIIGSGALAARIGRSVARKIPPARLAGMTTSARSVQDTELLWISARGRRPVDTATLANAVAATLQGFVRTSGSLRDEVVILKAATPPTSPASPNETLNIALALVLGLIFNSALALLLEILRDRMPDTDELSASLGYPVLATIPTLVRRRSRSTYEPRKRDVLALALTRPVTRAFRLSTERSAASAAALGRTAVCCVGAISHASPCCRGKARP